MAGPAAPPLRFALIGRGAGIAATHLRALVAHAERAGVVLLHENEKGIYGDTPARCRELLDGVGSPALRAAFDPANFVQVGAHPMREPWPLLAAYTAPVHVKDARLEDGAVVLAGEGDGNLAALLAALAARGYRGYLTLEPHLIVAGSSGGFSGAAGMRTAVAPLCRLLADVLGEVPVG